MCQPSSPRAGIRDCRGWRLGDFFDDPGDEVMLVSFRVKIFFLRRRRMFFHSP